MRDEGAAMTRNEKVEAPQESALLKRLVLLGEHRRMIAGGVLAVALLTALIVCIMPVTYTATTVILTPQTMPASAAALLGELGSLGSLASVAGGESQFKSPSDTFLGVLSSRTVADALIQRFDLQHEYRKRTLVDTRTALAHHTRIETTKGYLIRISVEDRDVQRATAIANGYVDALYRVNQQLALTSGSQRRLFLEQQLDAERGLLAQAEEAFQKIQQQTGMIQLAGQTEITLRSIAQIRAAISAKEVEMQLLRTTVTEQNVQLQQLESEVAALKEQLAKAESSSAGSDSDYFIPAGRIPQTGLEYLRRARDLRYHEALFEMLAKQYETARLEEAKSPPIIQVVDKAIPFDKRSWPPRTLLVMLAALFAAFTLCSGVLLKHHLTWIAEAPANAAHLRALRAMFASKHGVKSSSFPQDGA